MQHLFNVGLAIHVYVIFCDPGQAKRGRSFTGFFRVYPKGRDKDAEKQKRPSYRLSLQLRLRPLSAPDSLYRELKAYLEKRRARFTRSPVVTGIA